MATSKMANHELVTEVRAVEAEADDVKMLKVFWKSLDAMARLSRLALNS